MTASFQILTYLPLMIFPSHWTLCNLYSWNNIVKFIR